jgi:hypothetical protein
MKIKNSINSLIQVQKKNPGNLNQGSDKIIDKINQRNQRNQNHQRSNLSATTSSLLPAIYL